VALHQIGEIARRAGVSPETVRLYERKGLLRPAIRAASGYRGFSSDTLERIRLIRCALAVGFTLGDLAPILRKRDSGGVPCHEVRSLAREKLAELTRSKKELERVCRLLKSILRQWEGALAKTRKGTRAGLLDSLASRSGWLAQLNSPFLNFGLRRRKGRHL
jgi:MerR family transcriptional regulator, copper efflux regulator